MLEVGYKFRFFEEDAKVASSVLGIAHFKQRSFYTASIPVHRLEVHVNRLVVAGYKVGVVRQIETAALKAAGNNKSGPFERKLVEVYTKGTYLATEGLGGWILAIHEYPTQSPQSSIASRDDSSPKLHSEREAVEIGIVAVRAETGQVVWDVFRDGYMRDELERRLIMLDVVEVICFNETSTITLKTLVTKNRRIETLARINDAKKVVRDWYIKRYPDPSEVLAKVLELPGSVLECLAGQMQYLAEFALDSIFTLTNFFKNFSETLYVNLPATTLASLEIFTNSTNGEEKGSLFWVLNNTRTLPGRRLLKAWVGRPLLNIRELEERQEAVQELIETRGNHIEKLKTMLKKLPDLDKGLAKIFYGKSSRPEMLQTLQAFFRISRCFDHRDIFPFSSPILKEGLPSLRTILELVDGFLGEFNHQDAAKDDKFNMFKENNTMEQISDHKLGILIVETELQDYLEEIKNTLKKKHVSYISVAGIEYLIEIKSTETKLVPKTWIKVNGTRLVSRFHTPRVLQLIQEREQRKESLAIECDKAYSDFLKRISEHYDTLRGIVSTISQLDCLLSLAAVSAQTNFAKPEFTDSQVLEFEEARHPIIERVLIDPFVPNDVSLAVEGVRGIVLTGPNMGGKSSYIRQVALCAIMAQIGCYVPAKSARMGLLDGIFTRMGASDNMANRESTFMVELHECSDIMQTATSKSLVILDELGRGTSTFDGLAISHAVLHYFLTVIKSLTLFVTHYPSLGSFATDFPNNVRNYHMGYLEQDSNIVFLYKLTDGIAHRSYGLNVARLAGLDARIVAEAERKAKEFEEGLEARIKLRWAEKVVDICENRDIAFEKLLALADQV